MTDLQHKQNLMTIVAASLIPNRKSINIVGNINKDDINYLVEDCESIVNAIIRRTEQSQPLNVPIGTDIFITQE